MFVGEFVVQTGCWEMKRAVVKPEALVILSTSTLFTHMPKRNTLINAVVTSGGAAISRSRAVCACVLKGWGCGVEIPKR